MSYSYQSKKRVNLNNPIVFSFDLKDTRDTDDYVIEQFNFGISQDRAKKTVDESIHVFKNSIIHKTDIIDEVSCIKAKRTPKSEKENDEDLNTFLINCGHELFGKKYIFLTSAIEQSYPSQIELSDNFIYDLYIQNSNPKSEDIKISIGD